MGAIRVFVFALLLAVLGSLAGCANRSLIGTWEQKETGATIVFAPGNTASGTLKAGPIAVEWSSKYREEQDRLILENPELTFQGKPLPAEFKPMASSLLPKSLTLKVIWKDPNSITLSDGMRLGGDYTRK